MDDITSTQWERLALGDVINLTDGHARQPLSPGQQKIVAELPKLFSIVEGADQAALEARFSELFFSVAGEGTEPIALRPLLSYSASCSTWIVAHHLKRLRKRVGLIEPCFDNISRLIRLELAPVCPIPEEALQDPAALAQIGSNIDALWIVLPNNPTGYVMSEAQFDNLLSMCAKTNLTLIIDWSFRLFSDDLFQWPQYRRLLDSGISFICIEDTGKTWKTLDMKVGIVCASGSNFESLYELHDNLLLNVSPFHLTILSAFIGNTLIEGVPATISDCVVANRKIVDTLYSCREFQPASTWRTNAPLEWVRFQGSCTLYQLLRELREKGVHLLCGDNFFWSKRSQDGRYFRIPLNRSAFDVRIGVSNLLAAASAMGSSKDGA